MGREVKIDEKVCIRALLKYTLAGEEIKEGMAIIRILIILGKSIVKITC